jgi:hypothetical protein
MAIRKGLWASVTTGSFVTWNLSNDGLTPIKVSAILQGVVKLGVLWSPCETKTLSKLRPT